MFQMQYLNKKLKRNSIEKILSNYNMKYITMKKEIENKINIMIETVNNDISSFLNNMEEIAEERKKLKTLEYNKNELEFVREQLKEKIHELTKIKREFELLKQENKNLKNEINNNKSKRNNVFSPPPKDISYHNLNYTSLNKTQKKLNETKSFILKTEKNENKKKRFKSPLNFQITKTRKKISDLVLDDKNKNIRIKLKNNKNSLSNSLNKEIKTESNIKNVKIQNNQNDKICVIKKKILNKNNDLCKSYTFYKGKSKINKNTKNTKLLNKTTRNFNKIDKNIQSNPITNYDNLKNESLIKKPSNSYEKDNISITEYKESNSNISIDNIDDEINEMNDIEDEILSIMDKIKEFKKENST